MNFAAPVEYPAVLGALAVLNWPVYRVLWRATFQDAAEAKESVHYFFVRSFLRSVARGEVWKQLSVGSKAGLLFITIMVILSVEYAAVASIIDLFAKK
jgi:hypothetical protein